MKQTHFNSNSSCQGYRVEVRDAIFNGRDPIALQDGMVTDKWREVSLRKYPWSPETFGNSIHLLKHRCEEAALSDLLDYPSASALAHWLVSLHPLSQLRCRLVAYKLEWSSTLIREGLVDEPEVITDVAPENITKGLSRPIKPESSVN